MALIDSFDVLYKVCTVHTRSYLVLVTNLGPLAKRRIFSKGGDHPESPALRTPQMILLEALDSQMPYTVRTS
jgi:hypothetical protein